MALTASRAAQPQKQRFTEIDVERINIVEPDGKYRMVISNRPRSIGPIYKGKPFGYPGGTRPGIIFFNDEGTENGGLTFTGERGADGRTRRARTCRSISSTRIRSWCLNYSDNNGQRQVRDDVQRPNDRPIIDFVAEMDSVNRMPDGRGEGRSDCRASGRQSGTARCSAAPRLFIGRDRSKRAMLRLPTPLGRARVG